MEGERRGGSQPSGGSIALEPEGALLSCNRRGAAGMGQERKEARLTGWVPASLSPMVCSWLGLPSKGYGLDTCSLHFLSSMKTVWPFLSLSPFCIQLCPYPSHHEMAVVVYLSPISCSEGNPEYRHSDRCLCFQSATGGAVPNPCICLLWSLLT